MVGPNHVFSHGISEGNNLRNRFLSHFLSSNFKCASCSDIKVDVIHMISHIVIVSQNNTSRNCLCEEFLVHCNQERLETQDTRLHLDFRQNY